MFKSSPGFELGCLCDKILRSLKGFSEDLINQDHILVNFLKCLFFIFMFEKGKLLI